jgi:hypothetical protein
MIHKGTPTECLDGIGSCQIFKEDPVPNLCENTLYVLFL